MAKHCLISRLASWTAAVTFQWDTATYDLHGYWSAGNPSRITIPIGVTKIRISWGLPFTADSTRNAVGAELYKNGAVLTAPNMNWLTKHRSSGFTNNEMTGMTCMLEVTAGDYFELRNYYSGMSGDMAATNNAWISVEDLTGRYEGCVIYRDTGLISGNWQTARYVTFDNEYYDPLDMFDAGVDNQKIYIPAGVTKARAFFQWNPDYSNQTHTKSVEVRLNGTIVAQNYFGADGPGLGTEQFESDSFIMSRIIDVSEGDYFEAYAQLLNSAITKPNNYQASNWFEVQIWA